MAALMERVRVTAVRLGDFLYGEDEVTCIVIWPAKDPRSDDGDYIRLLCRSGRAEECLARDVVSVRRGARA